MKKYLKALVALLFSTPMLFGAAGDIRISQRNSSNTAWPDIIITNGSNSIIGTNATGVVSKITIGANMTLSGGVLDSTGGGGGGSGNVTGSSLTANAVILGAGSNAIAALAALGNSGAPLLSAGAGAPPAFGPINLASGSNIVTGALQVVNGGTSFSTYAVGDMLYASGSGTLSKLVGVATGNVIRSGGVGAAPAYGKVVLTTDVSGTLPVANGGTGLATITANSVLTGNGTGSLIGIAPGTSGNVLMSDGTAWTSAVNVGGGNVTAASTYGTDNILIRSDGTGRGTQSTGITIDDSNNITGVGNITVANLTTTDLTISGTITGIMPGANGGTGVANTSKTITLGANLTTTGTSATTLAFPSSGTPTYTLPAASQTLASLAGTEVLTNKTFDTGATGNVFKAKGYIYLTHPHLADGSGAIIGTTATSIGYGHAAFSNSADQAANYVEYYFQVPEDIDTTVALRGRIKVRLGNTDTATHRYVLSSVSVADSAVPTASTLANAINIDFAGDGSGASGDVETSAWTTLTSWAGALTAGQTWRIRFARDGNASEDASTVDSTELGLVLEYGLTQ